MVICNLDLHGQIVYRVPHTIGAIRTNRSIRLGSRMAFSNRSNRLGLEIAFTICKLDLHGKILYTVEYLIQLVRIVRIVRFDSDCKWHL